jgi:hypothetical protein
MADVNLVDALRKLLNDVVSTAATCRKHNTDAWMEHLCVRLNEVLDVLDDPHRLKWTGDGFAVKRRRRTRRGDVAR